MVLPRGMRHRRHPVGAGERRATTLDRAPAPLGQHEHDIVVVFAGHPDLAEPRAGHGDAAETDLHAGMLEAVARPQRLIAADPRVAALDDGPGMIGIGGAETLYAGRCRFTCRLERDGWALKATHDLRRNPGHCSQSVDWMATLAQEQAKSTKC